jgi:2-oxoglutarate ferredoxin oxidoreductase subunit alpha
MGVEGLEALNQKLQAKLNQIQREEVRYETQFVEDAEVVLVAFGTAARVAQTAVQRLRRRGLPVGLFRPITLWPFPEKELAEIAASSRGLFVVEMNAGQMLHDVRLVAGIHKPVKFLGRMGGRIPLPEEVEQEAEALFEQLAEAAQ